MLGLADFDPNLLISVFLRAAGHYYNNIDGSKPCKSELVGS